MALSGVRVVVTRARQQTEELSVRLQQAGAVPIVVPVIEISEPSDGGAALRTALERLADYDWVILTSVNAARRVGPFLSQSNVRVGAIGPGTAAVLRQEGVDVDLIPERFVAESLLAAFPPGEGRVLLPRAAVARDVLVTGLQERGWDVDVVEAYRTTLPNVDPTLIKEAELAEVITFTASSTVSNYVAIAGIERVPGYVACIGPITAETARVAGLQVDLVAEPHTIEGLVTTLGNHYRGKLEQFADGC